MPTPTKGTDPKHMTAVSSENDTSSSPPAPAPTSTNPSSPTSPERRDLPHITIPTHRPLHSPTPNNDNNNNDDDGDDPTPRAPQFPSTVQTPPPHRQTSHITGNQETTASSHDADTATPLDHSPTLRQQASEQGAMTRQSGLSRVADTLRQPGDEETVERQTQRGDGSPDRFFMIDEETRVESDGGAGTEGRAEKREGEDAPRLRREGTREGDRERRVEELREGVLEAEGKL